MRAIDSDIEKGIQKEMEQYGLDKSDAVRSLLRLGINMRNEDKTTSPITEDVNDIELVKIEKTTEEINNSLDNLLDNF
ncbi:hypothetical protein [Bacillus alkalicola]|uniref:Uncharacterized protein n=1 Tax=Evansella alkalicola TaxID=745819 RepID=A0ABS6K2H3_9BACI|nr:hypothetical protein [Bacillus alkalicola]MBU9724110.1 hypothetical protein [Bacillus alkalicola]